ncbi:hypothetical protein VTK73DRAFT_1267 [Phialemonium thermophilum]|uniref:HTH APSES-type domain-containing protein n=1 Tax=Phialemonium thermophilum TaxID=223376 RepID=A0ABR3XA05_9PEZI
MAPTRSLPARRNPLLTEDVPPYSDLVARRRLGQTQLTPRMVAASPSADLDPSVLGAFDYAHLRAPLPKGIVSGVFKSSPNNYFLMRRSSDGFVSATGMFKATFPYAETEEEEAERKYIKSLPTTSPEETAGNVWIPPEQALILAEEYHILPWIQALLDPTDIPVSSGSDGSPTKTITAPPKFIPGKPVLAPPTASQIPRSTRGRRSASPTKSSGAKRAIASPRKRSAKISTSQTATSAGSAKELASQSSKETTSQSSASGDQASVATPASSIANAETESIEGGSAAGAEELKTGTVEGEAAGVLERVEEEPALKVHVDQDVKVGENGEITRTHVEVEMPFAGELPSAEEAARMVAEAKEMVKAATEGIADATESGSTPASTSGKDTKKNKRKAAEIESGEGATEGDAGDDASEQPRTKKVKTEVELRKERIRKRAFIGIGATVAVGAIIPYVMGVL